LIGQLLDPAALDRALELDLARARPLRGNEFKVKLARNAARRALMIAGAMT
jgi:CO/xanthine dehydrogenase FAD-binding subunit